MRTRALSLTLALVFLSGGAALAQDKTAAAVLMVEDEGWGPRQEVTEPLGTALYSRFLVSGTYREVFRIQGRDDGLERLAGAIQQAAARHDVVDVFLSVHTTRRDPERWAQLIPPASRKLRLVYSTACHGNAEERQAWEAVAPQTIVTHQGINNPLLALPRILSGWLAGRSVGELVAEGYTDTRLAERFFSSLPGGSSMNIPNSAGSRPVVTGDASLRITSGLGYRSRRPDELAFSLERGGAIGLALRALARPGFSVRGDRIRHLIDQVYLPVALPSEALAHVRALSITRPSRGDLHLDLGRSKVDVPLEQGFELRVKDGARLWAGRVDVGRRRLEVHASGVWLKKGILRIKVDKLTLRPDGDRAGYEVKANIGVFGVIPWRYTRHIGGHDPAPIVAEAPIFRAMPVATGIAEAVAGLVD